MVALTLKRLNSEEIVNESTENCCFRQPHCCLTPSGQGTPADIRINLILAETRVIGLHFRLPIIHQ